MDGDIIWAPAIDGAFVLSTRGGDFDLQLGTDVSIGYLPHDADTVQLYLQETLKSLVYTAEASVGSRHSSAAEELLAIDDRPVDFAGHSKLTRIVNGPRLEGETPADGRGRLGDDLDGAAHSGRASVLDAHRCADGIPSAPRWRTRANSRTARRCSPCSPRPRTSTSARPPSWPNSCCSADGFGRTIEVSV